MKLLFNITIEAHLDIFFKKMHRSQVGVQESLENNEIISNEISLKSSPLTILCHWKTTEQKLMCLLLAPVV